MQHLKSTTPIRVTKEDVIFPLLLKLLQTPRAYGLLSALQMPVNIFSKTTEKLKLLKTNSWVISWTYRPPAKHHGKHTGKSPQVAYLKSQ